jgi:lysophospholipase L1-like esterase
MVGWKRVLLLLMLVGAPGQVWAKPRACGWYPAWASSQMLAEGANALPAGTLADATLRQTMRVSVGGAAVRVRVSNAFGHAPLRIAAATIGRATAPGGAGVAPDTLRPLHFAGRAGVTIPAGAEWLSDPVEGAVPALADLAVSLHVVGEPDGQTSHPGSRTTSHVVAGDHVADGDLTGAAAVDHWYIVSRVEMQRCVATPVVVALGDSITDGYGIVANGNARWTDGLARRLGGRAAVLNQGIGGNRVLLDGLGPNAVARFDRDVIGQGPVTHLIVLEGINDIGMLTRDRPAGAQAHRALVDQITDAYAQMIARAHMRGIRVYGATITPFGGSGYYHPDAANEADRQAINRWIRTPGHFDAVIDFDRVLRDPARPDRLAPRYDSGDHLHPGTAGYLAMADAVPIRLFD